MNVTLDRAKFFEQLKASILFGKTLKQTDVTGVEAILDTSIELGVVDPHHISNQLAQVYHETGGYMLPIKETVYASHTDKNPSDATVIKRLDNAYAKGQLKWVKTPYWRDGWFGRGPVQITHKHNYVRLGDAIGVDLVGNRDLALDVKIGAKIVTVGMSRGLFTGRKLSDFDFPSSLQASASMNPRRIVNGVDGTDAQIAKYHMAFHSALMAAGYSYSETVTPILPTRTRQQIISEIEALVAELKAFGD